MAHHDTSIHSLQWFTLSHFVAYFTYSFSVHCIFTSQNLPILYFLSPFSRSLWQLFSMIDRHAVTKANEHKQRHCSLRLPHDKLIRREKQERNEGENDAHHVWCFSLCESSRKSTKKNDTHKWWQSKTKNNIPFKYNII